MGDSDRRGPENMTGRMQSKREIADLSVFAEGQRTKLFEGSFGIFSGVERQGRLVFRESLAIRVERIFFLNMGGIGQQDFAELRRWSSCVYGTLEAFSHEQREQSAVVDMGMREKDGVDRSRIDLHGSPIADSERLDALIQPAIDEDTRGFGFEQVFRSGDRSGRPEKRDLHADFQIQSVVDAEYDNPKERKLASGLCAP